MLFEKGKLNPTVQQHLQNAPGVLQNMLSGFTEQFKKDPSTKTTKERFLSVDKDNQQLNVNLPKWMFPNQEGSEKSILNRPIFDKDSELRQNIKSKGNSLLGMLQGLGGLDWKNLNLAEPDFGLNPKAPTRPTTPIAGDYDFDFEEVPEDEQLDAQVVSPTGTGGGAPKPSSNQINWWLNPAQYIDPRYSPNSNLFLNKKGT